ncbi:hypothetical protein E2C01_029298 [Portunus trituberculatus]|uniref:Secreted protein n=1 Tax=Portunus trituberculatus TaxID=210409 RepID=A0A5B7EMX7_PORTR|nr:hypothetical protein [Portunus trituberculatus]
MMTVLACLSAASVSYCVVELITASEPPVASEDPEVAEIEAEPGTLGIRCQTFTTLRFHFVNALFSHHEYFQRPQR